MDENKQLYTIILRHDTSTQWAVNNPILTLGEYAVEDDTHRVKRGDGETEWNDLPYEEFGLVYLVNYKNLSGEVSDNPQLQEALDTKMSIAVFEDVGYQAVSSINIQAEEGAIGKITKISKNIDNATTDTNMLLIKSTDNSIQGYWSIDDEGVRILNLISESSITDYEVGHMYYRDQLCYYKNRLYRAVENFEAELDFNPIHWVILASKHAEDIAYDNLSSELDSENVQDALDELKRRVDTKVTKTTEERVVYGTTNQGKQTVIPIDDLRTVDSVNGVRATDQETKNIQIDADDINYDDDAETPETIREKLDQKVDKNVAGEGAKIVRDVQFNYNPETGHITLIEDKFSLEDGSSAEEEVEIDVVSEKELSDNVQILNDRIDQEVQTLNDRIDDEVDTLNARMDDEVDTLNTRIDNEVSTLNTRIDNEVDTLNNTINTKETAIYNRIQAEHDEINLRVTNEVATLNATITALDTKVDSQVSRLDGRIDVAIEDYNSKINNLTQVVANNKADIENKLTNATNTLDNKIDQAVNTLNNTISRHVDTINDRIDDEVETLNTRITVEHDEINLRVDNEVSDLNDRIDTEVADLHTYIDAQDDLKIDKDIADNIVALLDVATHGSQPTIRITNKNTHTKNTTYDYVHFTTAGLIKTRMEDADHLVIDSTAIDTINTQQNARLTSAENRLNAHDTQIASLLEHDVVHDREIAANASQIANHETRILDLEDRATALEAEDVRLDGKIEREITDRTTADAQLSNRIATNAVNIANNAENIRTNAESIIELGELLERNIENLTQRKAEKTFAEETGNKVVGKLESDILAGTELANLKATMVSPVDGTSSIERIKIISSDGTVIATRDVDTGVIDIRTNLDTDVNYFVTTDIISTTIADVTTLDMANLTPTDKVHVEVQDIISDPEGTWGRVMSIDEDNNTCDVVTFKKHAQAVWGTIKGNIADQADLQQQFADTEDRLQDNIDTETANRQSADTTLQTNIDNEATARQTADTALDNAKVAKVNTADQVYGTDSTGAQTTFNKDDLRTVDTVNGVSADANKNIEIGTGDIASEDMSGTDTTLANVITELQTKINQLTSDLTNQIKEYIVDTQYTVAGNFTTQQYVTFNNAGIILMAKVLRAFTSNSTEATAYESFIYDVEHDNLQLVGIPEEVPPVDPVEKEAEESLDILNEVDGLSDSYDGLGGTVEEVENILSDVLGE